MERQPTALVTGAATGIGAVIAHRLVADGYGVHICDVDPAAISRFEAKGLPVTASLTDVGDPDAVESMFDEVVERYGQLDLLINNAGIAGPTAPAEEISPHDWQRTVAVDLNGAFYCARRAIPLLKQSESGTIINIASNAAFFGFPLRLPYAVCKWGLIGLTKTLAMELGPHGIRVNAICPGSVDGERINLVIERDAAGRGVSPQEIRDLYTRQSSLRKFVTAEDVASTVAFLASDGARLISGQAIGVDGHTESLSSWLD